MLVSISNFDMIIFQTNNKYVMRLLMTFEVKHFIAKNVRLQTLIIFFFQEKAKRTEMNKDIKPEVDLN